MGLDIYVGTLTRYLTGDWELASETWAREAGLPLEVIRPANAEDAITDPDVVREAVLGWRNELGAAMGQALEWREDDAAPYFTDKPDWRGWISLQLLAAHVEHPELELPDELPEDPYGHPLLAAVTGERRGVFRRRRGEPATRFVSLYSPELWLPVDADGVWAATFVTGDELRMASALALELELRDLASALGASAEDLAEWRGGVGGRVVGTAEIGGQTVEQLAPGSVADEGRFALALALDLVGKAVEHRLPVKLDY